MTFIPINDESSSHQESDSDFNAKVPKWNKKKYENYFNEAHAKESDDNCV
jgi:hypothetical protein